MNSNQLQEYAVFAENLCKRYTDDGPPILENYGMKVRKGTMYGLVGPSGCGKSTLIKIITGLQKWDAGELLVFGRRPGAKERRILAGKLGYMPQDLALYEQLTVKEVCQFYGIIYDMSAKEIQQRWEFLEGLLELPTEFRQIRDLSGGQKRRGSLALALIHSPDLLVLDEPTVGLDAVLREKIWTYLQTLVHRLNTTIIITTHYIEEARQSNAVGIMRNGRLLVEDSPQRLLQIYNLELLEDVVLQLCRRDAAPPSEYQHDQLPGQVVCTFQQKTQIDCGKNLRQVEIRDRSVSSNQYSAVFQTAGWISRTKNSGLVRSLKRIYGFTVVLILILLRHLGLLALIIILPTIQGTLTLLVIGREPRGMELGIVNPEMKNWTEECKLPHHSDDDFCDLSALSCKFLNLLGKDDRVTLISAENEEEALSQVHRGDSWGYLSFPPNYTQHGIDRAVAGIFAMNSTLDGFRITARLDYSQSVGRSYLIRHMLISFKDYLTQLVGTCDLGANLAELPLYFRKPVYGEDDGQLTGFIVPGVILCSYFCMTMGLAALILIADRNQGTLSRARAAGLRSKEVLLSYTITQGAVSVAQIIIWQAAIQFVTGFVINGPLWLWFTFCVLTGICGATMGILVGTVCKNEVEALIIALFFVFIFIFFGAALLPTEIMTPFAFYVGRIVPTNLATVALRWVVVRGAGLTHPFVWPGLVVLVMWSLLFLIFSEVAFKKFCK